MGDDQRFDELASADGVHERKYFTRAEAEALVGRRIRSLVDFSGVAKGTSGRVIRVDPAGQSKPPFGKAVEVFSVAIQWDLPRRQPFMATGTADGEPFVFLDTGKPLVDWFSKDEYERYLMMEGDESESSEA
jgi:hypothetical protein